MCLHHLSGVTWYLQMFSLGSFQELRNRHLQVLGAIIAEDEYSIVSNVPHVEI